MTQDEREEGASEPIEDLEAPAEAQEAVAGGLDPCGKPSMECAAPTCHFTGTYCKVGAATHDIVNMET